MEKDIEHKQTKVIMVSHAPFVQDNKTRSKLSGVIVDFYDRFIGPKNINKFDAVVNICDWEVTYLNNIGLDESKRVKIPNVIPNDYFNSVPGIGINRSVLFLGRVAPIKNIEFILDLATIMPYYNFSIVGPVEESYMKELSKQYPTMPKNVTFYPPVYNLEQKIKVYDAHKFYILSSTREAMPQSLMEAMARGRIVISTDTDGAREIIFNGHNGFIIKTPEEAKETILQQEISPLSSSNIIDSVESTNSISVLSDKYERLFKKLLGEKK